ncbi:hypothetical protein [Paraburkholderia sp. DHOC27]|uniref:hypothetical protein n=1 Tax=Paraburkholderia sp. DHOC27 TaxID=2303330 RepID=UPI0011C0EA8A|nr:hypothetical protein [Paraburkholderia sp. DHOC27]
MRFQYRRWTINATPDISDGGFRAHARISPGMLSGEEYLPVIDQADLGHFSREALAVEHAINWAMIWIDTQEGERP